MDFKRPSREQQTSWEQASYLYQSQMTQECLSYLHGRGLNTETIDYFRLGYVANPIKGHEMFRGRLCIPYIKKRKTVALKFRCIENHECGEVPKHTKYLCDGEQWLFNTNDISAKDYVAVAEGEIDAMVLHQIGIPAVGIPGVKAWRGHPHWHGLPASVPRVYMYADNDTSKETNYGLELGREIKKDVPGSILVTLPEDSDVNSTYLDRGPEDLYERAGIPWTGEAYSEGPSLFLVAS
jgi:DNA primase